MNKRSFYLELLKDNDLFIYVNTKNDAVVVPSHLKGKECIVLQFGLNMAVPIPDLNVSDTGIYGTLSFSGKPFYCSIPWDSVYAVRVEPLTKTPVRKEPVTNLKVLPKGKPKLRVIKGGKT
jgi:hypothetical protein